VTPQVPPTPSGGGNGRTELVRVCSAAELADDTALGVEVDGEPVCVARSGGRVFALRDVCSHAEVMLSQGEVEDGQVECWLHGSQFDLETGEPTCLPATEPVPTYAVVVSGDDVFVDLESVRTPAHIPTNAGVNAPTTRK
jgi:3-phenylpropionate/trans-cinnamate dioxygenase ferredoxin subunit